MLEDATEPEKLAKMQAILARLGFKAGEPVLAISAEDTAIEPVDFMLSLAESGIGGGLVIEHCGHRITLIVGRLEKIHQFRQVAPGGEELPPTVDWRFEGWADVDQEAFKPVPGVFDVRGYIGTQPDYECLLIQRIPKVPTNGPLEILL